MKPCSVTLGPGYPLGERRLFPNAKSYIHWLPHFYLDWYAVKLLSHIQKLLKGNKPGGSLAHRQFFGISISKVGGSTNTGTAPFHSRRQWLAPARVFLSACWKIIPIGMHHDLNFQTCEFQTNPSPSESESLLSAM